ncbi:uncharacterized protein LOC135385136 [Ornithodoros turicata]|uniref:uncharacterized protein LOC135385136 n=1 Tax=Ornithodoros turicata TaxID=34597 RepID=UPI00313958F7
MKTFVYMLIESDEDCVLSSPSRKPPVAEETQETYSSTSESAEQQLDCEMRNECWSVGGSLELLAASHIYAGLSKGDDDPQNCLQRLRSTAASSLVAALLARQGKQSGYESNALHVQVSSVNHDEVSNALQSFWELEHLGIVDSGESEGKKHEVFQRFQDTTRFEDGRYTVRLPWNEDLVSRLGNNKAVAEQRLRSATRTLLRDQEVMNEYDQVIRQYLINGHAERIDAASPTPVAAPEYYMPHHAVIRRERETTKVRIVFDASSSAPGFLSLNQVLHAGPNLNSDILSLLLRFRMHRIGMVADIEKAFLQIALHKQDTDALRFLWYTSTPIAGQPLPSIETWRMTRVPFGARSSPFLLSATIQQHLQQVEKDYLQTATLLEQSFYVDDLVVSVSTSGNARTLHEETLSIFEAAGMKIKKWVTNDEALLREMFKKGNSTTETTQNQTKKALGVIWDLQHDQLRCSVASVLDSMTEKESVKRHVLQTISRIYDPFGLLGPFTISGKIMLQKIWEAGLQWNDQLPSDIDAEWREWCKGVVELQHISVPREIASNSFVDRLRKLHIFADASPRAYGAVVYLEHLSDDGSRGMAFLLSKSRVSPLKRQTLPRLELTAALLAARLYRFVSTALQTEFDYVCWTDSLITLHWIKGSASRWKTYVANRVRQIHELTSPERWRHCPGEENPADFLTRGIKGHELRDCEVWWKGPRWLSQPDLWPHTAFPDHTEGDEECLDAQVALVSCTTHLLSPERFSSANRLLRVTAWILRYVHNSKRSNVKKTGPLSTEEMASSELYWIKATQTKLLTERSSHLENFRHYQDNDGLLRLEGRLQCSQQSQAAKHPILLPPASEAWFTLLIILREHLRMSHAGIQETLHQLREEFWVIKGRQSVKYALYQCLFCRRLKTRPCTEQEAPLPADRVTQQLAFEVVGVDFAGPLYYRTAEGQRKAYVALFTCTVTRAIHLELVSDQSFGTFLMAVRRFVARRGLPRKVYSDNFLTFKKAAREIPALLANQFQAVREYATQARITWEFIAERAAWWGGFWERMVRSVKDALRRTLGRSQLDFQQLLTVLTEVEAIVNSRPLTQMSEDPGDTQALSPSHRILGKRLTALPPIKRRQTACVDAEPLEVLQVKERLLTAYWRQWNKDYLLQLRSANLSRHATSNSVQPHQLVLLADQRQPRMFWKLARVQELHTGRGGLVRSCTLKTVTGSFIRRPIQLLHPLEV